MFRNRLQGIQDRATARISAAGNSAAYVGSFVMCCLPAGQAGWQQQVYQAAYAKAVEMARPTLYDQANAMFWN